MLNRGGSAAPLCPRSQVFERRINDAGLPRLRVMDGWISEVLNPLSGQVMSVKSVSRAVWLDTMSVGIGPAVR